MSFRWARLQKIAVELSKSATSEAHVRSAINRAYYAAYGEARDFVVARGYSWNRRGASHQRVWNYLKQRTGAKQSWERPAWKAIGDAGDALKQRRMLADYDSDTAPTLAEARHAIAQAASIIKRLSGLP
jgi:uncharacterized protein (UPF0332 family)